MAARKKTASKRPRGAGRTGRPTKYSARIASRIIRYLGYGCSKDDAARAAGIDPATFYRWQSSNRDFCDRVTRACEAVKPKLIELVRKGAEKDPRMALAMLERRYPEEWCKTRVVKLEGNPDKPVDLRLKADEELAEVARKLAGMSTDELRALRGSPSK